MQPGEQQPTSAMSRAGAWLRNVATDVPLAQPWSDLADAVVAEARARYGAALHSVYVRGSVAQGYADPAFSDFDATIVVHERRGPLELSAIRRRFAWCIGIDAQIVELDRLLSGRARTAHVMLLSTARCLWGDDLTRALPPLRAGRDTVIHAPSFSQFVRRARRRSTRLDPEGVRVLCRWTAKVILRTGYEVSEAGAAEFTREVRRCAFGFSRAAPQHAELISRTLSFVVTPAADAATMWQVFDPLVEWIEPRAARLARDRSRAPLRATG